MRTITRTQVLSAFLASCLVCALGPGDFGTVAFAQVTPSLKSPVRLALDNGDNELLVSDYEEQRIFVLDRATLSVVRTIWISGKPLAVAGWNNRIYVGNQTKGRVEVRNQYGFRMFNLKGAQGIFKQPNDIAIDGAQNLVFVIDSVDKVVKVFDTDGNYVRTISGPGIGSTDLTRPTALGLDTINQEVLVSDYGDDDQSVKPRIQIFDYTGNHLYSISGKAGMLGFRFSRPQGIATDGAGHVFMVDSLLGEVLVFDRATGILLKSIGSFGTAPGQLRLPLDVVLHQATQDVFVTNNRTGRVEVFERAGLLTVLDATFGAGLGDPPPEVRDPLTGGEGFDGPAGADAFGYTGAISGDPLGEVSTTGEEAEQPPAGDGLDAHPALLRLPLDKVLGKIPDFVSAAARRPEWVVAFGIGGLLP